MNPPFQGAPPALDEPRPPEPQRPSALAVERRERDEEPEAAGFGAAPAAPEPEPEPDAEPGADPESQEDREPARPAPVHVGYARTGTEPDVVSAPPARGAPRPSRSPFWMAVRSHLWLVAIVIVLVGAAGTAYWALRVHQRIGEATLERGIATREHASTVRCDEQQPNGAVWACGLVYHAESVCLIANVNPVGDWSTKPGVDLCSHRPSMTALLPARITSAGVVTDLRSQLTLDVSRCAKIPTRKVRWACLGPGGSTTSCIEVRIVPWTPWATDSSTACEHIPALRRFLREGV